MEVMYYSRIIAHDLSQLGRLDLVRVISKDLLDIIFMTKDENDIALRLYFVKQMIQLQIYPGWPRHRENREFGC